CQQYDIDPRTF
nr:immunoglobulin light chain junction region [Macaca mulatta]